MKVAGAQYNQNNFDQETPEMKSYDGFFERNKLAFTIVLVAISFFLLGIQLMPYIYGGSLGHFHSTGACGWPNDCSNINSFVSF